MAAIGDIVLFTLHQGRSQNQDRPAIVVRLHPDGHHADLLVLLAGEADEGFVQAWMPVTPTEPPPFVTLVTAPEGEGAGHWCERPTKALPQPTHEHEPAAIRPPDEEEQAPPRGRRR